uniref:hypothetical protein n=1 Tax=Castellaniella defragrans TaxID=75697 RepID=UPI00333FFD1A
MQNLPQFKIRAHEIGRIMSDAQSIDPALLNEETAEIARKTKKTDEEKALLEPLKIASLSSGAKTFCEQAAGEFVYGYECIVTGKYMEKGIQVEDRSIDLYNSVFFTDHRKNAERRENEWVSGECDIVTARRIIDIKSAWSLDTFPKTSAQAHDTIYEWQGRAYMLLWDRPEFEVAWCLVDTPEDLIGYEDEQLHFFEHRLDPQMRVTTRLYQRDPALERRMEIKARAANRYINQVIETIINEHKG